MAVDVDQFSELLQEERRRVVDAIEYLRKPIAQDRLAAIPWATHCSDCKRLEERG